MRHFLAVCLFWLSLAPARADDLLLSETGSLATDVAMMTEMLSSGAMPGIPPGWSDILVPDAFIAAFAPGSAQRRLYDEMTHFVPVRDICMDLAGAAPCPPQVPLDLPDASGFFDHHHAALLRLRAELRRAEAAPGTPAPDTISQLADLIETHDAIMEILHDAAIPYYPQGLEGVARLPELVSRRFLEPSRPNAAFTLTHQAAWQPEMGPLPVPLPDTPAAQALTRVIFRASNVGAAQADHATLTFVSDLALRSDTSGCSGSPALTCEVALQDGTAEVVLLVGPPSRGWDADEALTADIAARLVVDLPDRPALQVDDRWTLRFRRCREALRQGVNRLDGMAGTLMQAREELARLTDRIAALPGEPLSPAVTARSLDQAALRPDTANGYLPLATVREQLQAVIAGQGTDAWMRGEETGIGSLAAVRVALPMLAVHASCRPGSAFDEDIAAIRAARATLARRGATLGRLAAQADSAAFYWGQAVRQGLDALDLPPPTDPQAEVASLAGSTFVGGMLNVLTSLTHGAVAGEALAARANAVGAVMGTVVMLEAAYDLAVISELADQADEATAWMEAAAYFTGMRGRYDRLDQHLAAMEASLTRARVDACTCAQP
ncbi:MAG: hypothetical protein GC146_15355 [Limimaricola sp.]|uniref:hypothetical protein n=1 Tax=Limimaricola sp. TaxID=2211665 RepID=UPI001DB18C18|nr:hypothetical protein [Limimaricola sp.]MBI1418592.1 hypothetical protein [Limimaricola sp.]